MHVSDLLPVAYLSYDLDLLADGDVCLLLDNRSCLRIDGLAGNWSEELRGDLASVLRETCATAELGIARVANRLGDGDTTLWRELRDALEGSGTRLLPLHALPVTASAAGAVPESCRRRGRRRQA